ncbi:hypothetical protein [Levilactobacillus spicheri]
MKQRAKWGVFWLVIGLFAGGYALWGVFNGVYRYFPSEPVILSLGVLGCVISLIGIVWSFPRQSWGLFVGLVLVFWLVLIGAVVNGLLLWFGQTVTGFY